MGYLDSAGLRHFTAWVKSGLAEKQNTIAAGDGLSKTGDTLGVTTPVRSVVTQAEFNALPEAQRNKGLYVISDGGDGSGGSSAGEVYSTEETRIGTWIDGKPLYRKVVIANSPSASDGTVIPADAEKNYVSIRGYLNAASGSRMFFNAIEGGVYLNTYRSSDNSIHIQTAYAGYQNKETVLVLVYTKTTDEGGAA